MYGKVEHPIFDVQFGPVEKLSQRAKTVLLKKFGFSVLDGSPLLSGVKMNVAMFVVLCFTGNVLGLKSLQRSSFKVVRTTLLFVGHARMDILMLSSISTLGLASPQTMLVLIITMLSQLQVRMDILML